ncbi:YIP1 family protein [Halocynthiibacter styelae]|uniref:YIP1 family protein n=1 Tax=Halocynthiibacter styelae TaxID=2761955 RepID=A0A8J7ISL9_9RHOB|nr:YIP1 family protein [Paenihalocynthiibacter styelae]MBI1492229.1 YIP1 family protein [Paenihalocynthiibacter styelae]
MSVTRDILASYRRPREVFERRMQGDEGLALTYVIIFGLMVFVSLLPAWSRQSELQPELGNFPSLVYSGFLGAVFLAPLAFYILAGLIWVLTRPFAAISGLNIRLGLFWVALATTPLLLLRGLTEGIMGQSNELQLVALVWLVAFITFFTIAMRIAYMRTKAD